MSEELPAKPDEGDRWALMRDVAVIQVKLIVDGLRDLVLVPASLVAGIISVLTTENGKPGPHFYRLVAFGKRTERWINLFGALDNAPPEVRREAEGNDESIDSLVRKVEGFVVDEYQRGGITRQAKEQIDKALDALQRRA